jgi:hypothetical protein
MKFLILLLLVAGCSSEEENRYNCYRSGGNEYRVHTGPFLMGNTCIYSINR